MGLGGGLNVTRQSPSNPVKTPSSCNNGYGKLLAFPSLPCAPHSPSGWSGPVGPPTFRSHFPTLSLSFVFSPCEQMAKQVDLFFLYRTLDHTQQVLDSESRLCSALLASRTKRGRRRRTANVLVQRETCFFKEFCLSVCGGGGCKH